MSATLGMKNIKVKLFGTAVDVPNNAIAKLMYYLDCVATVVDYDNRILIDFQKFDELTDKELEEVYKTAQLLNPSLFITAGIFIVNQDLLFNSLDNQFFEITDETIGIHVDENIKVGGKSVKVLKVMACNNSWLSCYYYNPISEIERFKRDTLNRNYRRQIVDTQTTIIHEKPIIFVADFRRDPVTTACPFCRNIITTRTITRFNCLACFCFLIFNLAYCCYQFCLGKNVLCVDITHKCPRCGRILGCYKSC